MSGNYVLHCSCGSKETLGNMTDHESIEVAALHAPQFEMLQKAGWEIGDQRGVVYEHAGQLVYWILDHWRHGEMKYSYDNNSDPPVVLKVPAEAGLPEPCGTCKGRRLIPCPECK